MQAKPHRNRETKTWQGLLGKKTRQCVAAAVFAGLCATASANESTAVNQLIIKFSPETRIALNKSGDGNPALFSRLSTKANTGVSLKRQMSGQSHVVRLNDFVDGDDLDGIIQRLKEDPSVESVEPDSQILPFQVPTDTLFEQQWPLHSSAVIPAGMDLPVAWDLTENAIETVVAVIDTGILYEHVDLQDRVLEGFDFITSFDVGDNTLLEQYPEYLSYFRTNDNDGRDPDASDPGDWINVDDANAMMSVGVECFVQPSTFHGTAMAGIIAGRSLHNDGIAGMDWNAKILPARVSGKCGGSRSDMIDAIRWAAGIDDPTLPHNPTPAKIINLSLGSNAACGSSEQAAIDEAWEAGAVLVAAAGNSAQNIDSLPTAPATCNNVLAVGAIRQDGHRAYYSNYGNLVDISAPGGEDNGGDNKPMIVASNYGEQAPLPGSHYKYVTGTSGAAAHVSGVLSLMHSVAPDLSNAQLTDYLLKTTHSFTAGGYPECDQSTCGSGIVNAYSAVRAAINGYVDDGGLGLGAALGNEDTVVTGTSGGGCTVASDPRSVDPSFLLILLGLLFLRRRRAV